MKKLLIIILILIFDLSLFAQIEDTASVVKLHKIQSITLEEVSTNDSLHPISESPLIKSFEGIGVVPIKKAYKLNCLAVDSVLATDSFNPNLWRDHSYQAVHIFVQANTSPGSPSYLGDIKMVMGVVLLNPFYRWESPHLPS